MKQLNADTAQKVAKTAIDLNRESDPRKRLPDHHLIWVLERIANMGDGFVPQAIQAIIDQQAEQGTSQ